MADTEETIILKRTKARERWQKMTPEERELMTRKISEAMKAYWEKKDTLQRSAIGRKAAQARGSKK